MIGTVYKIEVGEDIYVGSTINELKERQRQHNIKLNKNKYKNKLYEKCRKYNIENIICILLEEKEIENDLEIRELEQQYMDKLQPSLNHMSSYTGLTLLTKADYDKEYRNNNIERIRERAKQYRENNKDKINEKTTCPICNSNIIKRCLSIHQKTKKCLSHIV